MSDEVRALERAIAAGKLDPVYVLYGDEPAAIRAVITALRKVVVPPDDPTAQAMAAFNHERFDGVDLSGAGPVLSACAQIPMMSKWRLVELANPDDLGKGPEAESTNAAAMDALAAYIKAPSPSTVLVISGGGIDGRSKLVTACKAGGWAHKFEAYKRDDDAVGFVIGEAQGQGRKISRDAAAALVASVGTGRSELLGALDQALMHAGDAPVGLADVEAIVAHTREAKIFDLTDAVGRGEADTALAVLARMFAAGEKDAGVSMQVLAMLTRQIRLIFTAKVNPGRVAEATRLPPFLVRGLEAQARGFSEPRLRSAYAALVRLDQDLKGGSHVAYASPYMALQRWILDTCRALPGVDART
ncbi:DNA polymerase III subunit delta [Nannocystis pusilla]|uniref:DNA polymerase III subunit delta n=1 Tax=Nannocystis pusilla TaxID=889268 RepID=UPI003DA4034A